MRLNSHGRHGRHGRGHCVPRIATLDASPSIKAIIAARSRRRVGRAEIDGKRVKYSRSAGSNQLGGERRRLARFPRPPETHRLNQRARPAMNRLFTRPCETGPRTPTGKRVACFCCPAVEVASAQSFQSGRYSSPDGTACWSVKSSKRWPLIRLRRIPETRGSRSFRCANVNRFRGPRLLCTVERSTCVA